MNIILSTIRHGKLVWEAVFSYFSFHMEKSQIFHIIAICEKHV